MNEVDVPFGDGPSYPLDLPLNEIQTVISIIRNKDFAERKEELAKAVWLIIGYGLGRTFKDPAIPGLTTGSQEALSDEAALEVLESMSAPQAADAVAFPIPPALIEWLIRLLLSKLVK